MGREMVKDGPPDRIGVYYILTFLTFRGPVKIMPWCHSRAYLRVGVLFW